MPAINRRAPRAVTEIMLSTISAMLAVVALFGGIGLGLMVFDEVERPFLTALGVGGFMGTQLLRVYGRSYLFAQLRPAMVAISDLTYVSVGAALVVAVWLMPDTVVPGTIFGILAAANLMAMFMSYTIVRVKMRLTIRWRVLRRYKEAWKDAHWALVGVITASLQSRAHVLVVTLAFGEVAFAALAAGAILFGPMRVMLQAWGMITRPFLARAVSRNDRREIVMTNRISFAAVLAGYAVLIALLYVFWDIADAQLYVGKYEDMEVIVVLWAFVTLMFGARVMLAIPMQAMRHFKQLAFATAIGAVVSLVSVIILAFTFGSQYSIAGVGMGEAASLVYVAYLYRRSMEKFTENGSGQGTAP